MSRAAAVSLAVAAFTSACAPVAPPPPVAPAVAFPRHAIGPFDAIPAALLEGNLVLEGRCLLLASPGGERHLALWPRAYWPQVLDDGRVGIVDPPRGIVALVGRPLTVGGGETAEGARAVDANTVAAAADCPGWPWWLVTGVLD